MSKERQQQRNAEVRQAIVDTAIEIGEAEGFEAISIRKIVNKLDYSPGIVYHYFKDKQEILDTIHEEANKEMITRIERLIRHDEGFYYNLKVIFMGVTELVLENPERYALIVFDKYSKRGEGIAIWVEGIEEQLQVAIAQGEIPCIDTRAVAFNIWSSFLGFHLLISKMPHLTREEVEKLFESHFDMLFNGILHKH